MGVIEELVNKELPKTCYVFKHSTRCPISFRAAEEVRAAEFSHPLFWINVVEQRDISNWVAQTYDVRHESPQLLRIEDGRVTRVWNHNQVSRDAVEAK